MYVFGRTESQHVQVYVTRNNMIPELYIRYSLLPLEMVSEAARLYVYYVFYS